MRMVFGRACRMHCEASTISTSLVPMPKATAPMAPCVEVCESPHTMVMPGRVSPRSGPTTWMMPLRGSIMPKWVSPKSFALRASASTCRRDTGSAMGRSWSCVGVLWSGMQKMWSGRKHPIPRARRPSKACGLVTSWQYKRSMYNWVGPSGICCTTWASHILSNNVFIAVSLH